MAGRVYRIGCKQEIDWLWLFIEANSDEPSEMTGSSYFILAIQLSCCESGLIIYYHIGILHFRSRLLGSEYTASQTSRHVDIGPAEAHVFFIARTCGTIWHHIMTPICQASVWPSFLTSTRPFKKENGWEFLQSFGRPSQLLVTQKTDCLWSIHRGSGWCSLC